jgi:hypothetical protein
MPRPTHATVTPWSPKEVAIATRLYVEGHTFTDIAQTLRRSRGEVAGKLFRLRREGAVVGRVVKERPPPREPKNPKPSPPSGGRWRQTEKAFLKPEPAPKPKPVRRIKVTPDHRPSPPRYVQPKPSGPPTCWELSINDCRFPIGAREPEGHTTFCAKPVEPGTSWCPDHHRIVYSRRPG